MLQVYFYSAKTREAAWSKPENARIVSQEEWEAFQTNQVQGGGAPGGAPTNSQPQSSNQGKFSLIFLINMIKLGFHHSSRNN